MSPSHYHQTLIRLALAIFALASVAATDSFGQSQSPYIPESSDTVVESLPKSLTLNRDRMASLREQIAANPDNSQLAAAAAMGYIKMGNEEGDPRFFGYARSAIDRWWEADSPPSEVVKVRAKLLEKDHQYAAALADLQALVAREPEDAQAWIEIVNLLRVLGRYDEAAKAVTQLESFSTPATVLIAKAPLWAATGKSSQIASALNDLDTSENADLANWILATTADVHAIQGNVDLADEHYRKAISRDPNNFHLKRTYADFLLDYGKAEVVLKLLKDNEYDNGCLLLLAVAAKRLKQDNLVANLKSKLETRFKAIRLRDSVPHRRFESRYELALENNPAKALEIALENWELQKENRDARAVLEAALAAKNESAAAGVVKFLQDSGNEDAAIRKLISSMEK